MAAPAKIAAGITIVAFLALASQCSDTETKVVHVTEYRTHTITKTVPAKLSSDCKALANLLTKTAQSDSKLTQVTGDLVKVLNESSTAIIAKDYQQLNNLIDQANKLKDQAGDTSITSMNTLHQLDLLKDKCMPDSK